MTLPTLSDIGRRREPTIATKNRSWFSGRGFEFPMSGCVGSVISKSGMVKNVAVAVRIASPSVSVQKLLPLPVSWPTFEFRLSASSACLSNVRSADEDDIVPCACAETRGTCSE